MHKKTSDMRGALLGVADKVETNLLAEQPWPSRRSLPFRGGSSPRTRTYRSAQTRPIADCRCRSGAREKKK